MYYTCKCGAGMRVYPIKKVEGKWVLEEATNVLMVNITHSVEPAKFNVTYFCGNGFNYQEDLNENGLIHLNEIDARAEIYRRNKA